MVALGYVCCGAHLSLFPTATVNTFGIKNGGFIYSIMYAVIPITSMMSFAIEFTDVGY